MEYINVEIEIIDQIEVDVTIPDSISVTAEISTNVTNVKAKELALVDDQFEYSVPELEGANILHVQYEEKSAVKNFHYTFSGTDFNFIEANMVEVKSTDTCIILYTL